MRTFHWSSTFLWACVFFGGPANAEEAFDGERSKELDTAFNRVRTGVVRILGTTGDGKASLGSAVLIAKEKDASGVTFGYFVTCSHVIASVREAPALFGLEMTGDTVNKLITRPGLPIRFLADPDHDLAVLRVPLQHPDELRELEVETKSPKPRGTAYGFGFGIFAPDKLHAVTMQIGATVPASNYLTDNAADKDWGVLQATRERFAGGMSGGPLFAKTEEENYKLVAVIFATDDNGAELTVPARYVAALREKAVKESDKLRELTRESAAGIVVPFGKEVKQRFGHLGYRDEVEWAGLSSWVEAFTSAAGFRERFQEIVIENRLPPNKKEGVSNLTIQVDPKTVREGESVEVWLNGFRKTFSPANAESNFWEAKLGDRLVGGDNLLAVRKVSPSRASAAFDVNDLVRTNPLAFTLRTGEGAYYEVSRSLPALVENYTVYVTLRRADDIREAQLRPDEQLRLAIRVDAIERFLNGLPFLLPVSESLSGPDGKPVARAKGDVIFAPWEDPKGWKPGQLVRLAVRSGQTVDVAVRGRITNLASDIGGIRLGFDDPRQTLPFEFHSRLHFVRERDGPFHVTMRATAATSDGDFKIPILSGGGARVQADLSGLVTEVGLQYVNNRFLRPGEPRMIARERLARLISEIGGSGKGLDVPVVLRRAFLQPSAEGQWLIVTLGIQDAQVAGPKLPLLPEATDGCVVDLVGRQLPAALVAEFSRLGRDKDGIQIPPPDGTVSEFAFALSPPDNWWAEVGDSRDRLKDREKASRPAEQMSDAWKQLLLKGKATMRIEDRDLIKLLANLNRTVRWESADRGTVLKLTGDGSSFGLDRNDSLCVAKMEIGGQNVVATSLELKGFRVTWGGEVPPSFQGRVTAKEVQFGGLERRLTDIQGDIVVTQPRGKGEAVLKLIAPRAKVSLSGVEFEAKATQDAWSLGVSPEGRLSGKLQVELGNDAGRADFEFQKDRVRLSGVNLDLSRVKGVKEKMNAAVNKAIGFPVGMDLERLRIDSASRKLSISLTLKKRVKNDFPRIDEEVKLSVREEFDLTKALKEKKIDWKAKLGPIEFKIAEFHLPVQQIRESIDLDAIFGKGWDK